ncbi:MAG: hypothetical protein GQ564_08870 [Bacteroidales bacterium]|nr:hypothetical protein [Bacteroidales bacterium]
MDNNELIESKVVSVNLIKSDVTNAIVLITKTITERYTKGKIKVINRDINVLHKIESLKVA